MCKYGDLNFWTGVLWGGGVVVYTTKKLTQAPVIY